MNITDEMLRALKDARDAAIDIDIAASAALYSVGADGRYIGPSDDPALRAAADAASARRIAASDEYDAARREHYAERRTPEGDRRLDREMYDRIRAEHRYGRAWRLG